MKKGDNKYTTTANETVNSTDIAEDDSPLD